MTRKCAVSAHTRTLPDKLSLPTTRALMAELSTDEGRIEACAWAIADMAARECIAEAAIDDELARDPGFAVTAGLVG